MSTVSVNVRYIVPPVPKYSSFPKPNQSTVSVSLDASDVVRSLRSKLVRGWTFQIIVNGQAKVDGDTIASPESAVYIAVVNGQAEVKESSAGKPASAITTEAKSASSTSKATKGLRFSTAAKVLSALQRGKVRGRSAAGQAKPATSTSKATKGIKFSTAAKVLSALQRGKVRGVAEREETGDKKSDSAAYKDAAEEFLKSVQDADDEEGLQEILDELDGDGDGCISFDEFVRFLKQKVGRSSSYAVEEAQRAWLKIDKNGDLKLTFKEFKAHWKSMVVSANEDALSESAETSNDALEADALKEVRKSLSEARRLRLSTLSMLSNAGLSASNEDMVAIFDELARTQKTLQGILAQAKQSVAQADAQFDPSGTGDEKKAELSDEKKAELRKKNLIQRQREELNEKFYDQFWYGGTVEKAEELLKKGALINYRSKSGGTPLYLASSGGKMGHLMFLIENKCDLNITEGNRGETALIGAARKGQMAVARVLVDAGADITIRDKKRNNTAAEHANDRGAWDLHKYLKNLTK